MWLREKVCWQGRVPSPARSGQFRRSAGLGDFTGRPGCGGGEGTRLRNDPQTPKQPCPSVLSALLLTEKHNPRKGFLRKTFML